MKEGAKCLLIFVLLHLLHACALYKAPLSPQPQLNNKGDFELGQAVSLKNPLNAYLSYSPFQNVGLFVNGNIGFNTVNRSVDTIPILFADSTQIPYPIDELTIPKYRFSNQQIEFAAGTYFYLFENIRIDAYLGYGIGTNSTALEDYVFERTDDDQFFLREGAIQTDFRKYFIQSSLTSESDKTMNLNFGFRVSQINFHNFDSKINYTIFERYIPKTKRHYIIQPSLTVNAEIGYCRAFAQVQANFHQEKEFFSAHKVNLFLGVSLDLDRIFNKKTN